jgi:hypothetical protein
MLVERNSLRAISRIKHCKPHTVLHWLDLAGQHAAAVSKDFIHGLHVTQAQFDELWTFIKKNRVVFQKWRWCSKCGDTPTRLAHKSLF